MSALLSDTIRERLLKRLRPNVGISMREVARHTNLPVNTVSRFMAGMEIKVGALDKIAAFLDQLEAGTVIDGDQSA